MAKRRRGNEQPPTMEQFGLLPETQIHNPDDPEAWLNAMMDNPPPETVTVWVTAKMANAMWEFNQVNRYCNPREVKRMARLMRDGRWSANIGILIFAHDSRALMDGQHRIEGVRTSGVEGVPMRVLFAATEADRAKIDTGKRRTAADVLSFERPRVRNWTTVASAIEKVHGFGTVAQHRAPEHRLQPEEILEVYRRNPREWQNANWIVPRCRGYLHPSWAMALYVMMARRDRQLATDYFETLFSPETPPSTGRRADPTRRVWRLLADNRERPQVERFANWRLAYYVIEAWNALRTGDKLREMQEYGWFTRKADTPEIK